MNPLSSKGAFNLPAKSIRDYLKSTGWQVAERVSLPHSPDPQRLFPKRWGAARAFDLFVSDGQSKLEVMVPRDERAAEYERRVQDVLKVLEVVEDRSTGAIASEIQYINFDVIKSALPNSSLIYDAVPLDSAIDHVGRMRDLLSSSATTELNPVAFYGRVRKAAVEYSSRCLFGHTYRGSFGFTVQSPLTTTDFQTNLFGETVPFERKVLTRLVQGLENVKAAQTANDITLAINPESGLSANGFDILADLVENAGGQAFFEVAFSRKWRLAQAQPRVDVFEFSQLTAEVSREAADKLRATYIPTIKTVSGRIINLRNSTDPSQLIPTADARQVVVDFEDEDLGNIKIRIVLNASDYLRAVEAHKQGKRLVVEGLLERSGMRYVIQKPIHINVS